MPASIDRLRIALCWTLANVGAPAFAADAAPPPPIAVIELPETSPAGAGNRRSHHALSFATDAPKPFLRRLGIDASDCSMRLRLPSRIAPARESGAGYRVHVQAQAGLACRF